MDYVALVVFLALHYLRPQEWSPEITALRPIQLAVAAAVGAMIMRGKAIRFRDVCGTPHDWMVVGYFTWTVIASPTPSSTFRDILPLVFFYFVAVLVLYSIPRLKNFLGWWAGLIVVVAGLAMASKVGFDPFDSLQITEGRMKGRLVLNLSIFDNPNALGHALVPAIPILYYLVFWRKLFSKAAILLLIIPLGCIYMTQSKGAFVAAGITVLGTLAFGRPKWLQIAILSFALVFGGTLLSALPRMNELERSKSDGAIQGRVAAFKFGLEQMRRYTFGHGLGNFQKEFFAHGPTMPVKQMLSVNGRTQIRYVQRHYTKAPHSAYNQNGADLGYTGLFLFVGVLYCSLRTLITARTANDDEELLRRALFGVVVSYAVSSWMVDFCYRPTFFFFTAAVSDFHRLLYRKEPDVEDGEEDENADEPIALGPVAPAWLTPYPSAAAAVAPTAEMISAGAASVTILSELPQSTEDDSSDEERAVPGVMSWKRLGIVDLLLVYLLTEGAIRVWIYAINHM